MNILCIHYTHMISLLQFLLLYCVKGKIDFDKTTGSLRGARLRTPCEKNWSFQSMVWGEGTEQMKSPRHLNHFRE